MEKQKQVGGEHRNCTGASCTPNTQVYLLNPKSHCHFGQGHPYLQEPRWFLPPAHYLLNTLSSTRRNFFKSCWFSCFYLTTVIVGQEANPLLEAKHTPCSHPPQNRLCDAASFRHSRSLQFSRVSGELQPAFSTHARGAVTPDTSFAKPNFAASCSFPQESLWSHHQHWSSEHPMSNNTAFLFPRCTFLYHIRYKITMLNVLQGRAFPGGRYVWDTTWSYS